MPNRIERSSALTPLPRPPWLPEAAWPFESFTFEVDGSTVAFTDVGRGPVLLFVHTGLWSFIWRDVLVRLSLHFRCVCLDAPGTGRSGRPAGRVDLEKSTRAVTALIDQLGLGELVLVVHDLGGLTGVVGAARSSATVVGISAINAFAWRPEGTALRMMLRVVGSAAVREFDVVTKLVPRVTATTFGVGRHLDAESRQAFLARLGANEIRAFHNYLADALRSEALHAEASAALDEQFADLPLLTIFGEHNDPFHFQQEWRRRFPNATQLVIRGGNHFPMCDDPAFVAHAIDEWYRASTPQIEPIRAAHRQ
jgi:haloalkane dehalogenase